MTVSRIPLDHAVQMIFEGQITNAACVGGLLAAAQARDAGWAPVLPAG